VSEVEESEAGRPAGALGLADFLADLRAELADAQPRAEDSSLKLGVEEVTVALEVAVTTARKGGASGKLSAKFWVLNTEAGGTGERSSQRVGSQQLTLTLKPRVEQVTYDAQGRMQQVTTRSVDVSGTFATGEANPSLSRPDPQPVTDERAASG
jgi:YD repeat-containing protein